MQPSPHFITPKIRTGISWHQFPNKLLALESLPQGLLLGKLKLGHSGFLSQSNRQNSLQSLLWDTSPPPKRTPHIQEGNIDGVCSSFPERNTKEASLEQMSPGGQSPVIVGMSVFYNRLVAQQWGMGSWMINVTAVVVIPRIVLPLTALSHAWHDA